MKRIVYILFIIIPLSIPTFFLSAEEDAALPANDKSLTSTQPQDATDEINAMDHAALLVTQNEDAKEVQVLLNHFAGIIGNFFNIIQDPDNPEVVAPNIANMIGGMINIVVEAIKNDQLSSHATQKEITRFAEKLLDEQFTKRFVNLIAAKRDQSKNHH